MAPSRPVKLFVKNFPPRTTEEKLWRLLDQAVGPGEVLSVNLRGFSATVKVGDEEAAERAIYELDGRPLGDHRLFVRRFRAIKIFVGRVSEECSSDDIRDLFEEFGPVAECDIVKDYAFVHMEKEEDGLAAIEHLDGIEVKGRRICVKRSNRDRKRGPNQQDSEPDATAGKSKIPASSYRDQPSPSFETDYRSKSTTDQAPGYRNVPSSKAYRSQYETNNQLSPSSNRSFSSQSHSYEGQPSVNRAASYVARAAFDKPSPYRAQSAAAYDVQDDAGTSYATQHSDPLSTHDRASVEATIQQSTSVPLASGYRAQSSYSDGVSRSEIAARHSAYERVCLSPPRSSHEDLYREVNAINKRYMPKHVGDTYRASYECVRLSPPRGSHGNFDREANALSKSYAERPETATLHRPYERVRLSPPRSRRETLRATAMIKRY